LLDIPLLEEEQDLRDIVRRLVNDNARLDRLQRLVASPPAFAEGLWDGMVSTGIVGAAIPESYGGSGYGFRALGIALEELGRVLAPIPSFSTMLLGSCMLLYGATEEGRRRYLPEIATGRLKATAALSGDAQRSRRNEGQSEELSGAYRGVVDARIADCLVVPVNQFEPQRLPSLFIVDLDDPGVEVSVRGSIDPIREIAAIELRNANAVLVGEGESVSLALTRTRALGEIGLASEMLGGSDTVIETLIAYLTSRQQFGVPIGSFQALKHRCANLKVSLEVARAAVRRALVASEGDNDVLLPVASVAKSAATNALLQASLESIQMHGGFGFTWEHTGHLFLRRAKASQTLLGSAEHHRQVIADWAGVPEIPGSSVS
jgi:alkylation response protein AidB-like acyl-CoA dehydrogenase